MKQQIILYQSSEWEECADNRLFLFSLVINIHGLSGRDSGDLNVKCSVTRDEADKLDWHKNLTGFTAKCTQEMLTWIRPFFWPKFSELT